MYKALRNFSKKEALVGLATLFGWHLIVTQKIVPIFLLFGVQILYLLAILSYIYAFEPDKTVFLGMLIIALSTSIARIFRHRKILFDLSKKLGLETE